MAEASDPGQGAPGSWFGNLVRNITQRGLVFPNIAKQKPKWILEEDGDKVVFDRTMNGRYPESWLWEYVDASGVNIKATQGAFRKWRAMHAAGLMSGFDFTTTSRVDSYRPLSTQTSGFFKRYQRGYVTPRLGIKNCDFEPPYGSSEVYSHVSGAGMACPGSSVHGEGNAFDTCLYKWVSGKRYILPLSTSSLKWLIQWAPPHGFSWIGSTGSSFENWHLENYAPHWMPMLVYRYENLGQPVLKMGSPVSDDVKQMQKFLNVAVPTGTPLVVDGAFGPKTRAKVLSFENKYIQQIGFSFTDSGATWSIMHWAAKQCWEEAWFYFQNPVQP